MIEKLMKSTNIVVPTTLIIAAFALISMPQMISPVNAQSERASERACPTGFTLERGECTAVPITTLVCDPSTVGPSPAILQPGTELCRAFAPNVDPAGRQAFIQACNQIPGRQLIPGSFGSLVCQFPATEKITCPGGVIPTEEGECITKPGRGNNPT
jgi:hypothetical protein